MPNSTKSSTLLVCGGKDCVKKSKREASSLVKAAKKAGLTIETVTCLGACSGPTAVVLTSNGPRCFENLKGTGVQHDLCELATNSVSPPSKRLAERELTGKHGDKAAKRLAKQQSDKAAKRLAKQQSDNVAKRG